MSEGKKVTLPLSELAMVASTRALLGFGIGLLVSEHLDDRPRHLLGTTLTLIGALSTIPLGMDVLSKAGVIGHHSHEPDFSRLSDFAGRANSR